MKTKKDLIFSGIYKDSFEGYVNYKTALGYCIGHREMLALVSMNEFFNKYGNDYVTLTKEMAEAYVFQNPELSPSTIHAYECRVRQFGMYLRNNSHKDVYIYPENHVKISSDFVPYIFSNDEMSRIFNVTDHLEELPHIPNYRLFFQTIIRLLYSTGLRISEALSLRVEDVDFQNGIITILNGKGNVSRLVPFNSSLGEWLEKYHFTSCSVNDIFFFESPRKRGGKRSRVAIGHTFQNVILPRAQIKRKSDNSGPRLHDLRHTFACHCLDKMIADGMDPYCSLPYLSTYMGHKGLESTEKYLRLTVEHLDKIAESCSDIYSRKEALS